MRSAKQNLQNHVVFVFDRSASMHNRKRDLIRVSDGLVEYLASRSKELGQETRVTDYMFNQYVECVVYDMDVLRAPSVAEFYEPAGLTALVDATTLALDDLAMTPEKYGDHAFLIYVLTDGQENRSSDVNKRALPARLRSLPENWTVAVLVPDQSAVFEAKRFGFPADNIAVWDPTSSRGFDEGAEIIRRSTDTFMQGRERGIRGSRTLFSTGAEAVNAESIRAAALKPLAASDYRLMQVVSDGPIKEFVESVTGRTHNPREGRAFYQLTKSELIQNHKQIAVVHRRTGVAYVGSQARDIVGLPDLSVRVKPDTNPEYDIYVQSTSPNRKLIGGTNLLLMLTPMVAV